jgi:hypothetical protein
MRRTTGLVLALVAVLFLGACGSAPSVGDGVLGAEWAKLPPATVPMPVTGACSQGTAANAGWDLSLFASEPIDCARPHRRETFYFGTLDADASADLPEPGDDRFRVAYETCAKQAAEFLGGDFHTARVVSVPVMPSESQWRGMARWFRCEMLEITSANLALAQRSSSLRDGLRGARPLALTCANEKLTADKKFVQDMTFVGCETRHNNEMTGIYVAPDGPYPGQDKANEKAQSACYGIGATYLGMTRAALNGTGGISWIAWGGDETTWAVGDRSYWCFMAPYPSRQFTGSIKGRRPGSFPR